MKKNILFITRNGLLEPLGQSQILAYLVPLSKDFSISVISFEKPKDIENTSHLQSIKNICEIHQIHWSPLTYRKGLRAVGVLLGFVELFIQTIKISKQKNINIIHARSYYPAFIAYLLYKLARIPFIFDMRALWPEELVEAGRLKKNGIAWRIIKLLEKKCLQHAAAIVSLTEAAVVHLATTYPHISIEQKTTVIPTCADLQKFTLKEASTFPEKLTISCVGSMLSGWFRIDLLKEVLQYILTTYPQVEVEFLTRDAKDTLMQVLEITPKQAQRVRIDAVLFSEMPARLKNHDGSVFFFTPNISKLGSAPTRMAEILGTGIPVLTNSGVGDVANIVEKNKVGVLLYSEKPAAIHAACDSFINLLQSPMIANECRTTAEAIFSLENGVLNYQKVYDTIK